MKEQDPLDLLAQHRPFDELRDETSDDAKAAMLEEITMRIATAPTSTNPAENRENRENGENRESGENGDQTPFDGDAVDLATGQPKPSRQAKGRFRPMSTMPQTERERRHDRRSRNRRWGAVGLVLTLIFTIAAIVIPNPNTDAAYAAQTLSETVMATSGQVEAVQTHNVDGQEPIVSTTSFTFDGADAMLKTENGDVGSDRDAVIANGSGYLTLVGGVYDGRFVASEIFDRERVLGSYAGNLGTLDSLGVLFEIGEDVSRSTLADGTEMVTMNIRVDAAPGQEFDYFDAFRDLPAGISVAPEGNFDLSFSIMIRGELIDVVSYTAAGTRFAPELGREVEFTTTGSVQFSGINQPQQIVAPTNTAEAPEFDEWVLLSDPARTAYGNFFLADTQFAGLCQDFDRTWTDLLRPLSPEGKQNFEGLSSCFIEAGERAIASSIGAMLEGTG